MRMNASWEGGEREKGNGKMRAHFCFGQTSGQWRYDRTQLKKCAKIARQKQNKRVVGRVVGMQEGEKAGSREKRKLNKRMRASKIDRIRF